VHRQHGGAGEVQFTFGVSVDVAAEPVVGQVRERFTVEKAFERRQRGVVECELRQRFHEARRARDDAVAAPFWEPAGEDLEGGATVRTAVVQRRGEHGQLVFVRQ
jgi:hypothetical protein